MSLESFLSRVNPLLPFDQLEVLYRTLGRVGIDDSSQCWGVLKANGGLGFSQISFRDGSVSAHRLFYASFNGHSLDDIKRARIYHRCRSSWCVNPDHLYLADPPKPTEKRCHHLSSGTCRLCQQIKSEMAWNPELSYMDALHLRARFDPETVRKAYRGG